MSTVIYPYDPTGTNPECRIVDEQQVVTAVNFRDFHFIIPKAAPFFEDSVQMTAKAPDGTVLTLVKGVHYYFSHEFIGASRGTAKPVWGSITFLFNDFAGVIKLTYQTVGGTWTLDDTQIAQILANSLVNPRTTSWEQVAGYPTVFPVVDHAWDLVDLVGMSDVVTSIDGVRDAILAKGNGGLPAHLADVNNPHQTTKIQVGLGNVENFPIATQLQAEAGTNNTSYATPLRVAQAVAALVPMAIAAHTANVNNPHNTTATQVGLGLVQNYAVATDSQAIAGVATNLYVTPANVKAVVTGATSSFSGHVANVSNPHNVTAIQVGLGNVQNYGLASQGEAIGGTVNDKYMTPLRVAQAIAQLSSAPITTHIQDLTNPHQTTKAQVGLGSVDNFPTSNTTQAKDNTNNSTFMTPARVYDSVIQFVGTDFVAHLNAANPHNTTKTTVGLSNVQNYTMATDAEAQAAAATDRYMSPRAVSLAITQLIGTSLSTHISNVSNPHGTTKAQVGLGNVSNFATAADADGVAGSSTSLFMTPTATKAAINAIVNVHIQDVSNPHAVTKAQVGLGNVSNFTAAVDATGVTAGSTTQYTTAAAVKGYVDNSLISKLGTTQTAADSTKLAGHTYAEVIAAAASGGAFDPSALKAEIKTLTADAQRISSTAPITNNPTGNIWVKLGTLSLDPRLGDDGLATIKSDLHWLVAGGELPSAVNGEVHYLHLSIHAPNNSDGAPIYAVERCWTDNAQNTGRFYYVWDSANVTVTVYLKALNGVNPITVTNLNKAGSVIVSGAVSAVDPANVKLFTVKAAARDSDLLAGQPASTYANAQTVSNLVQAHNALAQQFTDYQVLMTGQLQSLADQINAG